MLRSRGTFLGGVYLPDEKASTGRCRIEPLPVTGHLRVAMRQHAGLGTVPCVAIGESVLAGQVIGRLASGKAAPVHSPISGRVAGIVRVETVHACYVPAVEIEPDAKGEWAGTDVQASAPDDVAGLADRVRQGGVTGLDRRGTSPADLLLEAGRRGVQHLIINGMESEPYLTAEYRLLAEQARLVVRAAELVAVLLGVQRAWLAVDRSNRQLLSELRTITQGSLVRTLGLRSKYPQGAEPLLVKSVLRCEIPYGGTALDVGAIVLDVATTHAIGRAIFEGRPCLGRVMTVAGDAVSRPGNYDVPLGTPIHRVIEHVGLRKPMARVVLGGPMTGHAVASPDTVTTKDVGALLLLTKDQAVVRRPGPCIRCGWCLQDCPVGLDPPALLAAVEAEPGAEDRAEEIARLHPRACLGCGICTYVCPAGLSLAEGAARARAMVSV